MVNDDGVLFFVIAAVLFGIATVLYVVDDTRASRFTGALVAAGLLAMSVAFIVERH